MVLVPLAHCLPRRQTALVVRVVLEGAHLGQGIHPALKGDLSGSDELLVLLGQVIFLLELGHDVRGKGFQGDFRVEEHQIAVLPGKILPERGLQHGQLPRLLILLQLRHGGVPKAHLPVIELVPCVDGVADHDQLGQCAHRLVSLLLFQENGLGLIIAGRGPEPGGKPGKLCLDRLQVRALVGHLGKFQRKHLLIDSLEGLCRPIRPGPADRPRSCSPA